MKPTALMQRAAAFFERLGVPYRIVGSMASAAYGEARFTNDVDILVELQAEHADSVVREFSGPEFYADLAAIRAAIQTRQQFNIIHTLTGFKIDVIQVPDTEFGRLDITRGRRLQREGIYDAWFGAPENVILMKLRYFQEGGSEKHLRDIASILLVQQSAVDRAYIHEWAHKLGVAAEWKLVCNRLPEAAG